MNDDSKVKVRKQLESLRLESEPENTRLMRIKYEEKQAEKDFIAEQKKIEDKLVEFNKMNKDHLEETKKHYDHIKDNDNKVIAENQKLKKREEEEIQKLNNEIHHLRQELKEANLKLKSTKNEKEQQEKKLKQLSIYENFLYKVMKATDEHDKDEKPKDSIKKMIERYDRLKKKQLEFKKGTEEKDAEKVEWAYRETTVREADKQQERLRE